jgi:hypothetical protein
MQATVTGDLHDYYPKVLVSYATGNRKDVDAPGCGPGMFYAKAVVDELLKVGVNTFSGLHVPLGVDWEVFIEKLNSRFSECKVLVVVVTPALYESKPCLEEIFNALKGGVRILPVLFENPMPEPSNRWPMITKADTEGKMMLMKVEKGFCKLNTTPSPPGDVVNQPGALTRVIDEVLKELDSTRQTVLAATHQAGGTL